VRVPIINHAQNRIVSQSYRRLYPAMLCSVRRP
jgi:hypothetical protein